MLDNRFGMLRETRDGGSAAARLRRATQRVCGEDSSSRLPWVRCELRQPRIGTSDAGRHWLRPPVMPTGDRKNRPIGGRAGQARKSARSLPGICRLRLRTAGGAGATLGSPVTGESQAWGMRDAEALAGAGVCCAAGVQGRCGGRTGGAGHRPAGTAGGRCRRHRASARRGTDGARARSRRPHVIDQKNLMFLPYIEVFRPGDAVVFRNSDGTRHHVYSFSPAKAFEFVLAPGQSSPPMTLDQAGVIVVVGCNIHDQMASYLVVSDAPWIATTGKDGRAIFPDAAAPAPTTCRPGIRGCVRAGATCRRRRSRVAATAHGERLLPAVAAARYAHAATANACSTDRRPHHGLPLPPGIVLRRGAHRGAGADGGAGLRGHAA